MAEVEDIYEIPDVGVYEQPVIATGPETYAPLESCTQFNAGTGDGTVSITDLDSPARGQTRRNGKRSNEGSSSCNGSCDVCGAAQRMVRFAVVLVVCVTLMIGGLVTWNVYITILNNEDGDWSTWNTWSSCSATCGNGFKTRSRDCTDPTPSAYGKFCSGRPMDIVSCSNNRCPDITSSFSVTEPKSNVNGSLTFSKVIYNLGTDFNPSTGILTCSKPGFYMFTFILVKKRRAGNAKCKLTKNYGFSLFFSSIEPECNYTCHSLGPPKLKESADEYNSMMLLWHNRSYCGKKENFFIFPQ